VIADPRARVQSLFEAQVAELVGCADFQALESGAASRGDVDRFLEGVIRSHLRSPKLLAFLYALAPAGEASENLRHNLLEELGIEEETGVAHPDLLRQLAEAAGLATRLPVLEAQADEELRRYVVDPLLYGSLKEVGLVALGQVVAFEYMLSRTAGRLGRALAAHHGLSEDALAWFTLHSEVDIRHAEQGLDDLVLFARSYGFADDDALTLLEMALHENLFIKRYFGEAAAATARGMG
jgi:pyrroloquinoline quinone (PQQ) biosynthesis protein C